MANRSRTLPPTSQSRSISNPLSRIWGARGLSNRGVGGKIHGERICDKADNGYIRLLAEAVTGQLGGKVGIAPRLFLKKLVCDVLDRIDQFEDFTPTQHYHLTVGDTELTVAERAARQAVSVDDIELNL
ncbi:hypothetical protein CCP4SC76_1540003 [Gammaproteobacteria bacterium]